MEKEELRKLKEAIENKNIGDMTSLVGSISSTHARNANEMLSKFYDHEVSVANAVIEIIAYSKVYKSKIKPPLKGCFCFRTSELRR